MLFNSPIFLLLFLPIVLFGFHRLLGAGLPSRALDLLLVASLVFYGWWDPAYLLLIGANILVNYQVGEWLRVERNRFLLVAGIVFNLALIAIFKYGGFFASFANELGANLSIPNIVLPLAISFFTFQQIAYLVDIWQGRADRISLTRYALFVTFFPQLIAGPIVHHSEMIPQFQRTGFRTRVPDVMFSQGLFLLAAGLFKKVVIADYLATWVDPVFTHVDQAIFFDAWVGALAYTFQLYFDFSGYSEMAMGLSLLFGYRLPINFDSPYKSRSISEFWRRWHITLGRFLREYLYIPLGGSRNGKGRMLGALMLTMLLGGLWHGAGWTYIAWGALHGIYLMIYHLWRHQPLRLPAWLATAITFLCVVVGWVVFRAESLQDAGQLLSTMAGFNGMAFPEALRTLAPNIPGIPWTPSTLTVGLEPLLLGLLAYGVLALPNVHESWRMRIRPTWRWGMVTAGMAGLAVSQLSRQSAFLYFQF